MRLNEIVALLGEMPEDERNKIVNMAMDATAHLPWIPSPGGQQMALDSAADELFTGGEPGGGKTSLLVGAAVTQHTHSIIFRREFPQIKGIEKEATRILGSRTGYNAQEKIWRIPGTNKVMEFGSCPHEDDKERYQGRDHDLKCVAAGTPILMADWSYKAIEDVRVGDMVQTLSGPREVTQLHEKFARAVAVESRIDGVTVARQVQGDTHRLLTPLGWAAHGNDATSSCAFQGRAELQPWLVQCGPSGYPYEPSGSRQPQELARPARRLAHILAGDGSSVATKLRAFCRSYRLSLVARPFDQLPQGCRHLGLRPSEARLQSHLGATEPVALSSPSPPRAPWHHRLDTSASVPLCLISESKGRFVFRRYARWLRATSSVLSQVNAGTREGLSRLRSRDPHLSDCRGMWGSGVALASADLGSDCAAFADRISEGGRRLLAFALQGLLKPVRRSGSSCSARGSEGRASAGEPCGTSPQGCQGDCSSCTHPRGGQPHWTEGVYLFCPQQLDGVGEHTPRSSRSDDGECTLGHSRSLKQYPHPYSSEIHSTDARVRVASSFSYPVGKIRLFDLTVRETNHYISAGGFINKNCFDEITHFSRSQYRYLTLWLRSTIPGQRCRIICTGNPPTTSEGWWVIEHWKPWLDETYHAPAVPGELRWAVPKDDDSDSELFFASQDEALEHVLTLSKPPRDSKGELIKPRSRTFIPAKMEDIPELANSGYAGVLAYASKELRGLASGKFTSLLQDDEVQVIPTAWIIEAQDRWTPDGWRDCFMTAMGFDPIGGGKDKAAIAYRHDCWFGPITAVPSKTGETATGVAELLALRRDGAPIIVDVGGGYAGGAKVRFKDNQIAHTDFNGSEATLERAYGSGLPFANIRAMAWFRLREALDPAQEGGSRIALPPDPELRSDLAAPRIIPRRLEARGEILLESKLDIRNRLGRSPDKGDAVVMCWAYGPRAVLRAQRDKSRGGLSSVSHNPGRSPRIAKAHQRSMSGGYSGGGEQG